MNQANPDSDSPAPFFCGAIYLSVPPTFTPTNCNLIPPLLSDRAGGWESRSTLTGTPLDSFQSYGATRSLPCAPGGRLWQAQQLVCRYCLGYPIFFVSRRSTKNRLLNQNPFHASTNTTLLRKSYIYVKYDTSFSVRV